MKKAILFSFILLNLYSCKSLMGGSSDDLGSSSFDDSDSPYVTEEQVTKQAPIEEEKAVVEEQKEEGPKIVIKEEKVEDINPTSSNFSYYAIIGSFSVLENAHKFKDIAIENGYKASILRNQSGLYRISAGGYNDEAAARYKINSIRNNTPQYSDAWLLKNQN